MFRETVPENKSLESVCQMTSEGCKVGMGTAEAERRPREAAVKPSLHYPTLSQE